MKYIVWILGGMLVGMLTGFVIDSFGGVAGGFAFFRMLYLAGGGAAVGAVVGFVLCMFVSKREAKVETSRSQDTGGSN